VADDVDAAVRGQDRLEGLREQAVVIRDQHANAAGDIGGCLHDGYLEM
jgi:hypothetical protein